MRVVEAFLSFVSFSRPVLVVASQTLSSSVSFAFQFLFLDWLASHLKVDVF